MLSGLISRDSRIILRVSRIFVSKHFRGVTERFMDVPRVFTEFQLCRGFRDVSRCSRAISEELSGVTRPSMAFIGVSEDFSCVPERIGSVTGGLQDAQVFEGV